MLMIVIAEGLVLFAVIAYLLFVIWKRKKDQTLEFEKLLSNVNSLEAARKEQLAQFLIEGHGLSVDEADESSAYMIEAEKQFLQGFLKQQIEQEPITGFYESLCELLDQYLYFVPKASAKSIQQEECSQDEDVVQSENDSIDHVELIDEIKNNGEQKEDDSTSDVESNDSENVKNEENSADLDWGDAFAESGDTMDEDTKAGFESEEALVKTEEDDNNSENEEEEPDWGDAFSESGDDMDEETKAGFESETKKE